VLMAAFTSLRWGELIALRRRHLDLAAGFVKVEAAMTEVNGRLSLGRRSRLRGCGRWGSRVRSSLSNGTVHNFFHNFSRI
jgi:integrase